MRLVRQQTNGRLDTLQFVMICAYLCRRFTLCLF